MGEIAKIITVKEPWATAIAYGLPGGKRKTIENRDWTTPYRGTLYIHAGQGYDRNAPSWFAVHGLTLPTKLHHGLVIARCRVVDVVTRSDSVWFMGIYGWVLEDIELVEPIARQGALGLRDWVYPEGVRR